MTSRIPPHNDDAEKGVIGAILIDKDAMHTVSELLSSNDFYNDQHGMMYSAMLELYEERLPIDLVTLKEQLKKHDGGEKITASYLSELAESVPSAAHVEQYCMLIKESSTKRRLLAMASQVSQLSFDPDKDLKEILETAESTVFSIAQGNIKGGFVQLRESLAASFDRIDELHRQGAGLRGVATGYKDLDMTLSGMQASNLIILAARPGVGKTAFALNIAMSIGVKQKKGVGIFSLEMSQEELVDRLLVGQADIDAWRLKTGKLTDDDYTKLSTAMGELAEAPIFIDDTPGISLNEIRTKARRLQLEHGVSVLVVDYLQLVDPGKKLENRVQEVSTISKSLKNLARELKIPVLALSQLNRAVEHREKGRPQLADLRESGSIEQDADVVMFLYRPDDDDQVNAMTKNMKLFIAKHRNGATGEIDLLFRGDRVRFFDMEVARTEVN